MDEPNLQTVPKPRAYKVLRSSSEAEGAATAAAASEQGSAAHTQRTANLRAAFVAPPGYVLLSGASGGGWVGAWCKGAAWRVTLLSQTCTPLTPEVCVPSSPSFPPLFSPCSRLPPD